MNLNRNTSLTSWVAKVAITTALAIPFSLLAQDHEKTYPSPQAATDAIVLALRNNDTKALTELLGPTGRDLLNSGDPGSDKADIQAFLEAYDNHHELMEGPGGIRILVVGPTQWPAPIPLRKGASGWYFDSAAGKQNLLFRRVGRNEYDAMEASLQLVKLQRTYAKTSHDGVPAGAYAARFWSRPGFHDGLYWEAQGNDTESPAGPLLAAASDQGYGIVRPSGAKRAPYGGYYYKILIAQGPHAPGGARNYFTNGALTKGFAILAYPAGYKSSGVMTFMTDSHGRTYEKDLGPDTAKIAPTLTSFDPDPSWNLVQP
ncbi:DUF2950 domain-containing protein [Terriglobus sp. ADX1]|uniref:DUF2950 domain-containing protein n=1 Tax=Terriglobus sp. ADX1 TaxID=2794063 RepID=UPI002FE516EF